MTSTLLHRGILRKCNNLTVMDCERCGYIHLSPLPRAEDVAARYSSNQFYGKDKPNYRADEERDKEWLENVCYPVQMALVADVHKYTQNPSLLDVGCGSGHFLNWAREKGWQTEGIEPAPNPHVVGSTYWNASIENVDSNPTGKPLDVIRAAWVLEHLLDPRAVLRKMRTWLKPGGVLLAIVPNDFSLIQQAVVRAGFAEPNYWLHETHINYFTYASLSRLLAETGFVVVSKFGTYPMEEFILQGAQYLGNDEIGAIAHGQRKQMELEMVKSDAGRETLSRLGLAMAEAELGRDMIFVARRDR